MFSIAATLSCTFHVYLQGCQLKHLLIFEKVKLNIIRSSTIFWLFWGPSYIITVWAQLTVQKPKTGSSNCNKECQRCTYSDNILLSTISPSLGAESVNGLLHKKTGKKRDKHQSARPVLKLLFIFCIQNKNVQHFQNKYVFYGCNNTFRKHLQSKYGTE